jgi:hypothetical protein
MKRDFKTDHFLVAYIDVLGQSNKLLKTSSYPPTKVHLKKIQQNLKATSYDILYLRNTIRSYFKQYRKLTKISGVFPKENSKSFIPEVNVISDSIFINVSLDKNPDNYVSINSIMGIFQGICLLYSTALSTKNPIRAGMDVGLCYHLTQNEVYGSAVAKAYTLESEKADYPRIMVGDSLWTYLNYLENLNPKTKLGKEAKLIATQCKNMVITDHGKFMLDVIGKTANKLVKKLSPELVQKGFEYIKLQCNNKDSNLSQRYQKLKNYYISKLPVWGLKP